MLKVWIDLSLRTFYPWLPRNGTLCLMIFFTEDTVAKGLPLEPTMANVFLLFYRLKWLEQSPSKFKATSFYRRYGDDFCFIWSAEYLSKFHAYFNTCLFHLNKKKWSVVISRRRSISTTRYICHNNLYPFFLQWYTKLVWYTL